MPRYRADGHGRAVFGPEMMVALLLYGHCQGERSSRVIEKLLAAEGMVSLGVLSVDGAKLGWQRLP